jgi:putative phage-type endonuclease
MMGGKIEHKLHTLTPEEVAWLRRNSIGGSSAPAIMRESPWDSPIWIWGRMLGVLPAKEVTPRMIRGVRLEPVARVKYEAETGIPMPAKVVRHPEILYMHGMLDGRNADVRGAIEIKSPCKEDHIEALNKKVPKKYVWQLVHYLAADPILEWIDYFSFNPDFDGPETACVRFTRSRQMERELLAEEKDFYRLVQTGTAPKPGPKELPFHLWTKYASYKGETMNQPNPMENPTHIARQLAAILEQTAKIANALASANAAALPPASVGGGQPFVMNPPAGGPICPVCGDKEKPSNYSRKDGKTTYCLTCHIKKKEAKKN